VSPKAVARRRGQAPSRARELSSREEAEAYVASVCFKHGPPRLLGVELEWLLADPEEPSRPVEAARLTAALGAHCPPSLDPLSPTLPLPRGSVVTVEPGGQVEIASSPRGSLPSLIDSVTADAAYLHQRLAGHGLRPLPFAADPVRPPRRVLTVPRYCAMEAAFDRLGTEGRSMMCSTAAVQPSLDLGYRDDLRLRWTALHALGPVLIAAFANSPVLAGRATGWKSSRMACWLALDPPRTAAPDLSAADPVAAYAARAMEADIICLRRSERSWYAPPGVSFGAWLGGALPGRPTTDDLDLHLSTLFPPVRPHGAHVEVRYVDAQPGDEWTVPVTVLAALLGDPGRTSAAIDACLPVADRWIAAARHGLADPALARAAGEVFALAEGALPALLGPGPELDRVHRVIERRVVRGLCPADLSPFVPGGKGGS
jgi:glutamate--cysteine ligase